MKKTPLFLAFMACISCGPSLADERAMMRLLQPTFKFQFCIREQTQNVTNELSRPFPKDWEIIEGRVWNAVLKDCTKYLDDDFKDRLYVTYKGDSLQARAFIDGVIWSGRAYVTSQIIQLSTEQK